MNKIVVLTGGTSSEREVSLRSGKVVADALRARGHQVDIVDTAEPLGNLEGYDAAFPAIHGAGGEDGVLQAELEKRDIPYVGSDSAVSDRCFDKATFKQLLHEQGVDVPRGEVVTAATVWNSPLAKQPYVLKPVAAGSSIDTFIVRDPATADTQTITEAFARYGEMLLEELVEGTEITVGVINDIALPVVEIIPPENGFFDYENKYNGQTQELCPAVNVSAETQLEAQRLALIAHNTTGCRDLSRTDMIVTPTGRIVVLETNTLPGMTEESLFPKAAAAAGMDIQELCDRLVSLAIARKQ